MDGEMDGRAQTADGEIDGGCYSPGV